MNAPFVHFGRIPILSKDELIWVSCSERVWRAARVLSTNANEVSVELLGEDFQVSLGRWGKC